VVTNCTFSGNSAGNAGGGAYSGTLYNCKLIQNRVASSWDGGGGAAFSTLNNCTLAGNSAGNAGGGALNSTLNNCVLTANSVEFGGGAGLSTLNNCLLSGNSALEGGGAYGGTLNNCTLSGNTAYNVGGGAAGSTLNNCILYYNTNNTSAPGLAPPYAANYDFYSTLNHCCSTPLPPGVGNITADPRFASRYRLSANSPCIGAGDAAYTSGTDIDGEPWRNPPSIGCDEYYAGTATGPLSVGITATYMNIATGYPIELAALIDGGAEAHVWDFGDGTTVSNQLQVMHAWPSGGSYDVVLTAYNQSYPSGTSATATVQVVSQPVHYVAAHGTNPVTPYSSWATAATNIQDAVDAAGTLPGTLILVSNGTYSAGSRLGFGTNRIVVDKPLILRSVNGSGVTIIDGGYGVRCVYLTNDASLAGFTLTNGYVMPFHYGAGVYCQSSSAVVSNCVIAGLDCCYTADRGAGAFGGTLINCLLVDNKAAYAGGAAYGSKLINCVAVGSSAGSFGGAAFRSWLQNCTITSSYGGNFDDSAVAESFLRNSIVCFNRYGGSVDYYSVVDHSYLGIDPLFIGASLRLQSNSPCINAGNNVVVTWSTDLDGNPRIIGGTVDQGAYEQQSPALLPYYTWLQQYGLPTDGSADTLDADLDGHNAWQEWKAWTDPTNALSVLKLLTPQPDTNGTVVTWQSVLGQSYSVDRATNAGGPFSLLQGNIAGQTGTTSVTDTNPATGNPILYRVAVPQ